MRAEESTRDAVKSTRQCRIWLPSRSCRFLSERLRRTAGIYSYKKDWGGGTTANLWYLHDSAHNYDYNKAYFAGVWPEFLREADTQLGWLRLRNCGLWSVLRCAQLRWRHRHQALGNATVEHA